MMTWRTQLLEQDGHLIAFLPLSGSFSFCTGTMEPLHDGSAVQDMLLLEMLDAHCLHRPSRPPQSWQTSEREASTTLHSGSGCGGGGAGGLSTTGLQQSPSRAPTGQGVLQYSGSRSDSTNVL